MPSVIVTEIHVICIYLYVHLGAYACVPPYVSRSGIAGQRGCVFEDTHSFKKRDFLYRRGTLSWEAQDSVDTIPLALAVASGTKGWRQADCSWRREVAEDVPLGYILSLVSGAQS